MIIYQMNIIICMLMVKMAVYGQNDLDQIDIIMQRILELETSNLEIQE